MNGIVGGSWDFKVVKAFASYQALRQQQRRRSADLMRTCQQGIEHQQQPLDSRPDRTDRRGTLGMTYGSCR
jgi:hypothetical protein